MQLSMDHEQRQAIHGLPHPWDTPWVHGTGLETLLRHAMVGISLLHTLNHPRQWAGFGAWEHVNRVTHRLLDSAGGCTLKKKREKEGKKRKKEKKEEKGGKYGMKIYLDTSTSYVHIVYYYE